MHSQRDLINQFNRSQMSSAVGVTTRAIVISNKDPMFAGRVKVWIPAYHGGFTMADMIDNESDDPIPQTPIPKGCLRPGDWKNPAVQATLPWARCLGSNWGSRQSATGAITISGIFSTPKVGTEVIVIFENNDPNTPIIIGAYFHENEFTYSRYRPLELFPGTQVNTSINVDLSRFAADGSLNPMDLDDYTAKSATAYSIRAENDSMLFISDTQGESAILLSGLIHQSDTTTLIGDKVSAIAAAYPGFPTTASAAFATRILLSTAATTLSLPVASTTTNVPVPTSQQQPTPAPEQPAAVPTTSVKMWPVKLANGAASPHQASVKDGAFGAPRPSYHTTDKRHVGLDIQITHDNKTLCVAPIDMIPMWSSYPIRNGGAGLYLLCLGADGTGHSFLHLYDIDPAILANIATKNPTKVVAGTVLGHCGNSGTHAGPKTTYDFHLHWEVFKITSRPANAQGLVAARVSAVNQGLVQFYDPLKWMLLAATTESTIQGSPDQHRSWIDHNESYSNTNDVNMSKPIGLEISTVPGQETLFLRHPSGSYLGFDVDGNIVGYSCGDINWRVNRSWNLDVLGGILETCYAKFTRARSVVRTWARVFSNLRDKAVVDPKTYPNFFVRAETLRHVDMINAVHSTLGNAAYISSDGTAIQMKDAYSTGLPGIQTPPNTAPRNIKLTTYDILIQKAYAKWVLGTALQYFTDWKWFKAQMLIESDGDPTMSSSDGRLGLFMIRQVDTEAILARGPLTPAQFNAYLDPAKNIDMAVQIMVNGFYQQFQGNMVKYIAMTPGATAVASMSAQDIMNLTFFSYKVTSGAMATLLGGLTPNKTITYSLVEALYINQNPNNPDSQIYLQYIPTLSWLHNQL